ncbi:MAG: formyl transferase [Chitinophagales bacterium]|nr:formyl transferase [Chitinophagales bacterium]
MEKIILLAGKGVSTNIVFNYLSKFYEIEKVILEEPPSKLQLIRKRIKRFGLFKVAGQLAFQTVVAKWLTITSRKRRVEIIKEYHLDTSPPPQSKTLLVNSINDRQVIDYLIKTQPQLAIVNGTRIISRKVLNATGCTFINMHAGITPKYRNVHGAYWALVNNDRENCGVTVHLVDPGIDTGKIIYQAGINPIKEDNFVTYPLLQVAEGVNLLRNAIKDFFNNQLEFKSGSKESHLWYHPTIFQYLYYRLFRGIK